MLQAEPRQLLAQPETVSACQQPRTRFVQDPDEALPFTEPLEGRFATHFGTIEYGWLLLTRECLAHVLWHVGIGRIFGIDRIAVDTQCGVHEQRRIEKDARVGYESNQALHRL